MSNICEICKIISIEALRVTTWSRWRLWWQICFQCRARFKEVVGSVYHLAHDAHDYSLPTCHILLESEAFELYYRDYASTCSSLLHLAHILFAAGSISHGGKWCCEPKGWKLLSQQVPKRRHNHSTTILKRFICFEYVKQKLPLLNMSISMANLPNNSCPILVGSSGLRLPCGFPAGSLRVPCASSVLAMYLVSTEALTLASFGPAPGEGHCSRLFYLFSMRLEKKQEKWEINVYKNV